MKKFTLVFASALVLGLSSCNKDDDSGSTLNASGLQGKWNFNTERFLVNGIEVLAPTNYSGNATGCSRDYLQFDADNTAVAGDYENDGSTCNLFLDEATYSTSGNTITVLSGGEITEFNVASQTATTLTLQDIYTENGQNLVDEYTFNKAE